jgi:hypothetical protein
MCRKMIAEALTAELAEQKWLQHQHHYHHCHYHHHHHSPPPLTTATYHKYHHHHRCLCPVPAHDLPLFFEQAAAACAMFPHCSGFWTAHVWHVS